MRDDPAGEKTRMDTREGLTPRPAPNDPNAAVRPEIPDHQLLRRIGSGSYGEVWLARNVMGTYRAVKIVYRQTFSNDRPYEREFTGIQKFEPISRSHEGLVDVLQVGRNDPAGYFYYVMELADDASNVGQASNLPLPADLDGDDAKQRASRETEIFSSISNRQSEISNPDRYIPKTLAKELHNRGRLPAEECLRLSLTLTSALGHLHQHGLIHRDIKPSNIIFVNGIPKLADIGLVADVAEARSFVGTEGFIPLEGPGTAQADLYSLGKVIYEICTGNDRLEFPELPKEMSEAEDREGLLELNDVVIKACENDLKQRYQSAEEMYADLLLFQSGKSIRRLHTLERRLAVVVKVGAALLAVGALSFGSYYVQQRLQRERDTRSRLELQRAEELLIQNRSSLALAYLARLVRQDPNNGVAASRLLSTLGQRTFARPVSEPFRHAEQIYSVRFSPAGDRVVTASADRTARVWESRTGRSLAELPHQNRVVSAEFSAQGDRIVTASRDGTARVWDAINGQALLQPLKHAEAVQTAQFSPDGDRIVTASFDQTAQIWDSRTGNALTPPLSHQGRVIFAQFSPDGNWVVTASADKTARVWDARSGRARTEPLRHESLVRMARFSPEGDRVVTASTDGTARVWNATNGAAITPPLRHENGVLFAEFSPDGNWVVTASEDKTARIWDAFTGRARSEPLRHEGPVHMARFSPDGDRIATAAGDGLARVWDARYGRLVVAPLRWAGSISCVEFSYDGYRLLTASVDGTAEIWDLSAEAIFAWSLPHSDRVLYAQFSPDGRRILTASDDGAARLWDAATGQPLASPMTHHRTVTMARFGLNGDWIVTASDDATARVWKGHTGEPVTQSLKHDGPVTSADFADFSRSGDLLLTASTDGKARLWKVRDGGSLVLLLKHPSAVQSAQFNSVRDQIVTACLDGTARIWDARSGLETLPRPLRHELPLYHAEFSPDGRWIVTASADKTARVWDARTGQLATELRHEEAVYFARFSPDGHRVATASADKTALVWDARKGHPLTEPLKHDDSVFRVQFSPAGDRIVTASADGTARIWDGLTGQPLTEPLRHQGLVHCVQFSPDGERVVTASNDQTARVWEVPKPPLPIPSWVADLAEAVAGQRVNHAGISEPTSVTNLSKIGRRLEAPSGSDFWSRWATWFLREHATRTISPFSPVSVSEYVRRRIEEGTLTSLREAARLSRTNDQVLVRLARELMAQRSDPGFRNLREADLLVRRACQFAPSNHAAWGTRAEILAARQKPHEAQLAILRALELVELERFPGQETLRSTYQATRRQIHSQLNRPSEAKDK